MQRGIALPIQVVARSRVSAIGTMDRFSMKFLPSTIFHFSRCGSSQHTLAKCRKPAGKANALPFASCFICKGTGHLASACPQNEKGVYPNGGCCMLCSKTDHLARDCPLRSKAARMFPHDP
jgi:hypothetical protein